MRPGALRDAAVLPGLPHLLTASRVVLGAIALNAALDGQFTRAAAFITASAVVDGLDGKVARWLNASSPFGGVFDYFCDYLCFLVAPWALTRGLLGPERSSLADAVLVLPLVTGAIRYARNSLLVTSHRDEVRQLPGLGTVFFAFVSVVAVFLEAPARLSADQLEVALLTMTAVFSLLMVAPVEYPKLSNFRGASPAVLALLTAMPILGTTVIAFAALLIGSSYVLLGPLWTRGHGTELRAGAGHLPHARGDRAGG
jgi:CDP-diacylglycerol--serine O-phosphatidyltransferase